MKAMILAAGRGLRMRPLTDKIPKSLLPIKGNPLIACQLLKLAKAGIQDIVINVSYQAKQVMETLRDGRDYGVNITYSYEPTPLETGGGICQALPLLGNDPFIVLSADIYTDYPIDKLAQHTLDSARAHLILVDNPNFHPQGDFHLLHNNFLTLNKSPKLTYANFGIYHPILFEHYKSGVFPLSEIIYKQISKKKVTGEYYQGNWFNIGTLHELRRLECYVEKKQYKKSN